MEVRRRETDRMPERDRETKDSACAFFRDILLMCEHACRVLAFGLIKNRSLLELRMNSNDIEDAGATAMADVLRANQRLMLLDLRANHIRSLGMCDLCDALNGNRCVMSSSGVCELP